MTTDQTPSLKSNFIIAIDGPAASGKGTLARRLARAFNLPHLDTGLTYRAVAAELLAQNLALDDEAMASEIAANIELGNLDKDILSDHKTGEAASKIAVMPGVRKALVEAQRNFASKAPGAVLDGRDIGTVVCPDADLKLFVSASPEVRAKRRHEELISKGKPSDYPEILSDLRIRDERDASRTDSPMKKACDALLLDTSKMDIETAFLAAKKWANAALAAKSKD